MDARIRRSQGRKTEVRLQLLRIRLRDQRRRLGSVSGEPHFEDDYLDTLSNPTVLIEVLSKSTERYDRIAKSSYYRTLDSLAEHLLVAQDEVRLEQYVRNPDGSWLLLDYRSLDDVAELKSIGCSLTLRDVYDKVRFDE